MAGVMTFDSGFRARPGSTFGAMSNQQMPARKSVLTVLAIEIRCAISTLGLIARRKLAQPTDLVNSHIEFADGSVSRIYRETTHA